MPLQMVDWPDEGALPSPLDMVNRVVMVRLPNGMRAGLCVTPDGQSAPSVDDRLLANGRLLLPGHPTTQELHPDLLFGTRLTLLSEHMIAHWGGQVGTANTTMPARLVGYRHKYKMAAGDTWLAAIEEAGQRVSEAFLRLEEALNRRHEMFQSDGAQYWREWEMLQHGYAQSS